MRPFHATTIDDAQVAKEGAASTQHRQRARHAVMRHPIQAGLDIGAILKEKVAQILQHRLAIGHAAWPRDAAIGLAAQPPGREILAHIPGDTCALTDIVGHPLDRPHRLPRFPADLACN